ncbi:hypothetical protein M3Y99_01158200 [Aphelenchoides fujianensis]|nr:hypothetical protein M3Y99_01158200 [Aphelenchoides fujianensis]
MKALLSVALLVTVASVLVSSAESVRFYRYGRKISARQLCAFHPSPDLCRFELQRGARPPLSVVISLENNDGSRRNDVRAFRRSARSLDFDEKGESQKKSEKNYDFVRFGK